MQQVTLCLMDGSAPLNRYLILSGRFRVAWRMEFGHKLHGRCLSLPIVAWDGDSLVARV